MRLIDADELDETLSAIADEHASMRRLDIANRYYFALAVLMATPTIDAVPVKRGTWKLNKDGSGTCDQCHFTQKAVWDFDRWQNFCGVCGADMRERKDGGNDA